jgi:hypothetical protein
MTDGRKARDKFAALPASDKDLVGWLVEHDDDGRLLSAYELAVRQQRAERAEPRLARVWQAVEAAEDGDLSQLLSRDTIAACVALVDIVNRGVATSYPDFASVEAEVFLEAVAVNLRAWSLPDDVRREWRRLVDEARKANKAGEPSDNV